LIARRDQNATHPSVSDGNPFRRYFILRIGFDFPCSLRLQDMMDYGVGISAG